MFAGGRKEGLGRRATVQEKLYNGNRVSLIQHTGLSHTTELLYNNNARTMYIYEIYKYRNAIHHRYRQQCFISLHYTHSLQCCSFYPPFSFRPHTHRSAQYRCL